MMKTVLYGLGSQSDTLPLVLINCDEDAGRIYDLCIEMGSPEFILAAISGFDWNRDLSPWPCDPVFKRGNAFEGKADAYLSHLSDTLLPQIEAEINGHNKIVAYRVLVGYSLAGLFALYSACNRDLFTKIVSASGSLWYPDFPEYILNHPLSGNVKRVYLSLGDKESNTGNPIMKTVEDNTKRISQILSEKTDTFFEFNEGNHFKDPELRTAKGIAYVLKT
ncbi:MAG: hypothetical protein J5365_01970 [Erysipelotrichaceae bacterium]|nr:hypothetical protein [Erysipelotrichaceae bacterium]